MFQKRAIYITFDMKNNFLVSIIFFLQNLNSPFTSPLHTPFHIRPTNPPKKMCFQKVHKFHEKIFLLLENEREDLWLTGILKIQN